MIRNRKRRPARPAGPSIREVCLVARPPAWSAGERVEWSGRAYRVASAEADGPGYVHLRPLEARPAPASLVAG